MEGRRRDVVKGVNSCGVTFIAVEVEVAEPGTGIVDMGSVPLGGDRVSGSCFIAVTAYATCGQRAAPCDRLIEMAIDIRALLSPTVPTERTGYTVAGHVAETVGMPVAPAGNECRIVSRGCCMAGVTGGIGAARAEQMLGVGTGPGRVDIAVLVMTVATDNSCSGRPFQSRRAGAVTFARIAPAIGVAVGITGSAGRISISAAVVVYPAAA